MKKILISRCLLGDAVRYDGLSKGIQDPRLQLWQQEGRLIFICPEVMGGLKVPRAPAEVQANGKVITNIGGDVSAAFATGAQTSLDLAIKHNCQLALLKARSPSCGSGEIYDGSFNQQLIKQDGLTTKLLKQHGIKVFNESQIDELVKYL